MKRLLTLLSFFFALQGIAQPNCNAFNYLGDTLKYEACIIAEKRAGHYQFSRAYQEALDEALAIDSTFAFAYRAKSTAYLKSGDFLAWKALMDKAVHFDPAGQLDYRGWCRYQFFRDYQGAIDDIERLDSLVSHDIGYSVNGHYHLHVARALCYKALGKPQKAITIIEQQLQDPSHLTGVFDYLHLGVLHMEVGNYQTAVQYFTMQEKENDLAENRYYLALTYKALGKMDDYVESLEAAKVMYESNTKMFDPYVEQMDKIFLEDIERELAMAR